MKLDNEAIEALRSIAEAFNEVFNSIKNEVINSWESIKELREAIIKKRKNKEHEYNWHVPKIIGLKDQVLTRKPITINIRTNL